MTRTDASPALEVAQTPVGVDIFATLVETLSDIVTLLRPDGSVIYQSPSIEQILGYKQQDRIGQNIFARPIVHPDDLATKRNFLAEAHRGKQARAEFRLRHQDGSWRQIEAIGVAAPLLGGIVATYRDVTDQRNAQARREILAEASELLSTFEDPEATLDRVGHLAVPLVADWCVIDLVEPNGEIRRVVAAHPDPAMERRGREISEQFRPSAGRGAAQLLETGKGVLSAVTDEMLQATAQGPEHLKALRSLDISSGLSVPLMSRGRAIGVMTLIGSASRILKQEDLDFATELAGRVALALDSARLYSEAESNRARLNDLFMQAPAFICLTRGPSHVFELVNPAMTQILGSRDLIGKAATDVIPEIDAQGIHGLTEHVYRTGETFVANEMLVRLDRKGAGELEEGYFNFVLQPSRDAAGNVDGVMVHGVEVTDQVKARRGIEALAAERKAILNQMTEGVVITDVDGRVTFMNDAAASMYGARSLGFDSSVMPLNMEILAADGQPIRPDETPLQRALKRGETVIDDLAQVIRPDKSEAWLLRSSTPVESESGEPLGVVMTSRDVTQAHTLEAQKNEFLSAVAHDLKTPLTAIKGHAQLLLRRAENGPLEPESVRESVGRIESTASRMTDMVNDLLEVTRAELHRGPELAVAEVDLVRLVRDVISDQVPVTGHHTLRLEADSQSVTGLWEAARISRAVSNVVANALRYSPNGGEVRVRVWVDGREAVVSVSDSGLGVPAMELGKIFDRFHRGSNVADKMAGTGLGLTSAKRVVEQHGGSILVESVEGEGSTFTIRLPLSPGTSDA